MKALMEDQQLASIRAKQLFEKPQTIPIWNGSGYAWLMLSGIKYTILGCFVNFRIIQTDTNGISQWKAYRQDCLAGNKGDKVMATIDGLIQHLENDLIHYLNMIEQIKRDNLLPKGTQKDLAACHKEQIDKIRQWITMLQNL